MAEGIKQGIDRKKSVAGTLALTIDTIVLRPGMEPMAGTESVWASHGDAERSAARGLNA